MREKSESMPCSEWHGSQHASAYWGQFSKGRLHLSPHAWPSLYCQGLFKENHLGNAHEPEYLHGLQAFSSTVFSLSPLSFSSRGVKPASTHLLPDRSTQCNAAGWVHVPHSWQKGPHFAFETQPVIQQHICMCISKS